MKVSHLIAISIIHVVGIQAGLNAARGKNASDWLIAIACGMIITVLLLGYGFILHFLQVLNSKRSKK